MPYRFPKWRKVDYMDIAQILRSQGFKVTPQRIAIYDALRGHHDHPTAEMLYHTLRPEHPSMSFGYSV